MGNKKEYFINDNVIDACNYWKSSISNFDSNLPLTSKTSSNGFSILKEGGFDLSNLDKYDSNVNELSRYINDYYSVVKSHFSKIIDDDNYLYHNIPKASFSVTDKDYKANVNVESRTAEIEKSNMSDLQKTAAELSKYKNTYKQEYDSSYANVAGTGMHNVNVGVVNDNYEVEANYDINAANLNNINKGNATSSHLSMNVAGMPTTLKDINDPYSGTQEQKLKMNLYGTSARLGDITKEDNNKVQNLNMNLYGSEAKLGSITKEDNNRLNDLNMEYNKKEEVVKNIKNNNQVGDHITEIDIPNHRFYSGMYDNN